MENISMTTQERGALRPLETITAEILIYKQQAGTAFLEIGRRLLEAKEQLEHGEWLPWLEREVEFSQGTAQRLMRLAREYPKTSPVTDLGVAKALLLLDVPPLEREEFAAGAHLVDGEEKTVAEMSKRELEAVIREREEARAEAKQLRLDLEDQLEEQRRVYDTDMEAAQEKLTEAHNRAEGFKAKAEMLRAELEELRNRPPVTVEEPVLDREAVEAAEKAAREETERKLKAKIEKANMDREKAEKAKARAERELAEAKVAREEAETIAKREREAMAEQMEGLRKKLAVAGSSETAIFKLHFEQAQESINRMAESLGRMWEAGEGETAGKLKNALAALLRATMEELG